jgi:hypothetical protein
MRAVAGITKATRHRQHIAERKQTGPIVRPPTRKAPVIPAVIDDGSLAVVVSGQTTLSAPTAISAMCPSLSNRLSRLAYPPRQSSLWASRPKTVPVRNPMEINHQPIATDITWTLLGTSFRRLLTRRRGGPSITQESFAAGWRGQSKALAGFVSLGSLPVDQPCRLYPYDVSFVAQHAPTTTTAVPH